ncbi:hypothetical protein COB11_06575 [Candidatus Aerophobetes bacterium]|uniref:Uncharacterized protein n=1 Tax=Aerophobetes bacterium TaxID=2030807 RepID=A0A2A4YDJ8_UNCAE|nr:MAG: hypothetical protein COB11_06575 [Candidatus Aerophobetes bacterium]
MVHVPCIGQVSGTKIAVVGVVVAVTVATVYLGGPAALAGRLMEYMPVAVVSNDLAKIPTGATSVDPTTLFKTTQKVVEVTNTAFSAAQTAVNNVASIGGAVSPALSYCGALELKGFCIEACEFIASNAFDNGTNLAGIITDFVCGIAGCVKV